MAKNYNPFQSGALLFPNKHKSDIQKYCKKDSTQGKGARFILNSPFDRIVDLWFLCVCTGVYFEEKKSLKGSYRFMEGSVLKENHEMIETLEIIAIAENNDENIINEANKMLEIVNQYAFAGIERIFKGLSGQSDNLWNLTDDLQKIVK